MTLLLVMGSNLANVDTLRLIACTRDGIRTTSRKCSGHDALVMILSLCRWVQQANIHQRVVRRAQAMAALREVAREGAVEVAALK